MTDVSKQGPVDSVKTTESQFSLVSTQQRPLKMISMHVKLRHTADVLPIVRIWKCYKIKHHKLSHKNLFVKQEKGRIRKQETRFFQ